MGLIEKLKETIFSVFPIYIIVFIMHFTISPLETSLLMIFTISTVLVVIGLSMFNLGVDQSIEQMGNIVGTNILKQNSLPFVVVVSFLVGFMVTFAEPDLQVLGSQLHQITGGQIPSFLLIGVVSVGTGIFVVIAMLRILFNLKLNKIFIISYAIIFILGALVTVVQPNLLAVSFDSGGVTTGPLTVPFIMSIGIGVASKRASKTNQEDSFGAVGLASAGPIMAVLVLAIFTFNMNIDASTFNELAPVATEISSIINVLITEFKNVFIALAPLVIIFGVLNIFYFKIKKDNLLDIGRGLLLNYIGVSLFLTGVNAGFSPVAQTLGANIISSSMGWMIIFIGFLLGLVIVFAEPAIWVLNRNVEEISGGSISKTLMMGSLSISVGLAVALAMARIYYQFSLWWYLIPGYLLTFYLMKKSPPLFTAIAFDSGGVSTGPMTATFILSMGIGAAVANQGNVLTAAFGLVAVVAMMPLIIIQLLGAVYSSKLKTTEDSQSSWIEEE